MMMIEMQIEKIANRIRASGRLAGHDPLASRIPAWDFHLRFINQNAIDFVA